MIDIENMKDACLLAVSSGEPVKVGCIIKSRTDDIICYGVNSKTKHAEVNAIESFRGKEFSSLDYVTAYVTKAPCLECAKRLLKSNISRAVFAWPYKANPDTGEPSKWWDTQKKAMEYLATYGVTVLLIGIDVRGGIPVVRDETEITAYPTRKKNLCRYVMQGEGFVEAKLYPSSKRKTEESYFW